MTKKVDWQDPGAIETIKERITQGKVVAGSSDTVIGLFAADTEQGRDALDRIKKRSTMPYLLLVKDLETAKKFSSVFQTGQIAELAHKFWPGPLTLIVPAKEDVPDYLKATSGGIALRVPDHENVQKLLAQFEALFSTSANLSGKPVPETIEALDPEIAKQVSLIISDEKDASSVSSTILDCMGDTIQIIREGAISKQRLQNYL